MNSNRRSFLKVALGTAGASVLTASHSAAESEVTSPEKAETHAACLVDTTLCIGCRKCEEACLNANEQPHDREPFVAREIRQQQRRPTSDAFTVVNRYQGSPSREQLDRPSTFVKMQCLHCLDPACVSACLVGAMAKRADGPVVYDPKKCMGCRYCMVACPFGVPAYEYSNPITPRVRKCEFCVGRTEEGAISPACAAVCPMEAIVFGRRGEVLDLARHRIQDQPGRYLEKIYGEHEVGGTSWVYLVGRSPQELDLPQLPEAAPPRLTEAIQHGIFRYAAIPLAVYGGLATLMWFNHRRHGDRPSAGGKEVAR